MTTTRTSLATLVLVVGALAVAGPAAATAPTTGPVFADRDATTEHGSTTDGANATLAPVDGAVPQDPDDDGLYEDVNGDGATNLADAGDLFQHRDSAAVTDHVDAYDFSGNGEIDLADVVQLFQENTEDDAEPAYAVAADGSAEFESIQAAVDDAGDGDTVRVAPGTYEQQVRLSTNVTLVAPDGATLRGDGNDSVAVEVAPGAPVAPTVAGFEVRGYDQAVLANRTRGDWTVRDLTVRNVGYAAVNATAATGDWTVRDAHVDGAGADTRHGVAAVNATGDWTLRNATVAETSVTAVWASDSTGDWTVSEATVTGSPIGGVVGLRTTGDWAVRNATVAADDVGVDARRSAGAWRLSDVTVDGGAYGVWAANATGDWAVADATLGNQTGPAVAATDATGRWRISHTAFPTQSGTVIDASDASPAGNATHNWWGSPAGATEADCVGNVDCGDPTVEPPAIDTVSIDLDRPEEWEYDAIDYHSQIPRFTFDRSITLANDSRYELVVRDEDRGGRSVVEPRANATLTADTQLFFSVPRVDADDEFEIGVLGQDDVPANVTRHGPLTTEGVANLSVSLRRAETGERLGRSQTRPYVVGWRPSVVQNDTTGTVELAVNRSALPRGTNLTATLVERRPDGSAPDRVNVSLAYRSDRDAFVGHVDADRRVGGFYDVDVAARLPQGTEFTPGTVGTATLYGTSPPANVTDEWADASVELHRLETAEAPFFDGYSELAVAELDRSITFTDEERYELVVYDEDTGGRIVVEPIGNGTFEAGNRLELGVPRGNLQDLYVGIRSPDSDTVVSAQVSRVGPVTTGGAANLSVAVREAKNGETLARSPPRLYYLGFEERPSESTIPRTPSRFSTEEP